LSLRLLAKRTVGLRRADRSASASWRRVQAGTGVGHTAGCWRALSRCCWASPAKQPAEKAAGLSWGLGRLRFQLLDPSFKLTDALSGLLEGMLLNEHRLHQQVGRIGDLLHGLVDQSFRFRILLRTTEGAHAVEQTGNELAFVWGHPSLLAVNHGD